MKEGEKNKNIVKFYSAEKREEYRRRKRDEILEKAAKEGVGADDENVFKAIAEAAYEQTQGRPFRFKKGRRVNVKRSSGEIQDDWVVFEANPTIGWVKVERPTEHVSKKLAWKDLYVFNPELMVGDIVSVERGKRGSGVIDNGWIIINFSFKEGEQGEMIKLATVNKTEEGTGDILEKTIPVSKLKELNP